MGRRIVINPTKSEGQIFKKLNSVNSLCTTAVAVHKRHCEDKRISTSQARQKVLEDYERTLTQKEKYFKLRNKLEYKLDSANKRYNKSRSDIKITQGLIDKLGYESQGLALTEGILKHQLKHTKVGKPENIKRSAEFVDGPIKVSSNSIEFYTREIYFYEPDGSLINVPFGPYSVKLLYLISNQGCVHLEDIIVGIDNQPESHKDRTGYSHPHISSRGQPCWGRVLIAGEVKQMKSLVLDALRVMDIEKVLNLVHAFLVTYNPQDPHCKLVNFVGLNLWDNKDQFCSDCRRYRDTLRREHCTCIKSVSGQTVSSQEELAPNGYTWNEYIKSNLSRTIR